MLRIASRLISRRCVASVNVRLCRSVFYESRQTYFGKSKVMQELKSEGIIEEHSVILYANENFTKGVEVLVLKEFNKALVCFKHAFEDILTKDQDYPDILHAILKRIAICQHYLGDSKGLGDTLRELFLVTSSDPDSNMMDAFNAIFNLGVYYCKHDAKTGMSLFSDLSSLSPVYDSMPSSLRDELEVIYHRLSILTESYLDYDIDDIENGMLDNNVASCRWYNGNSDTVDNQDIDDHEDKMTGSLTTGSTNKLSSSASKGGWLEALPKPGESPEAAKIRFENWTAQLKDSYKSAISKIEMREEIKQVEVPKLGDQDTASEQVQNMISFLSDKIEKSTPAQKEDFYKKRLKDFPIHSIHSIVPLMNLSELCTADPEKNVLLIYPARSGILFLFSPAASKTPQHDTCSI